MFRLFRGLKLLRLLNYGVSRTIRFSAGSPGSGLDGLEDVLHGVWCNGLLRYHDHFRHGSRKDLDA